VKWATRQKEAEITKNVERIAVQERGKDTEGTIACVVGFWSEEGEVGKSGSTTSTNCGCVETSEVVTKHPAKKWDVKRAREWLGRRKKEASTTSLKKNSGL
jgi:hypothetical protein